MSTRGFTSTFSLFFGGALLLIVLNPVSSSSTLCETRCENAVPNLKRLKTLWHNVSKRVGGEGKIIVIHIYLFSFPVLTDLSMCMFLFVSANLCLQLVHIQFHIDTHPANFHIFSDAKPVLGSKKIARLSM